MIISIIHLAVLFNLAVGDNRIIIDNNNNHRHLQESCADYNGQKTACINFGCTYEGGRFKLCTGELPGTNQPTSAQPTSASPTSASPTSGAPTTVQVRVCGV